MALFDRLKPHYKVGIKCENCGVPCVVNIRKGTTVSEAVKGREMNCKNCGCILQPTEYTTQWLK